MARDSDAVRRITRSTGEAGDARDVQSSVRRQARHILSRLPPGERESLIIKCWMSHDARWFMAVATAFGLDAAIRLNRVAVCEEGRAEARRLVRRLQLPPVQTVADYLLVQEVMIGLLGPDLLDYTLTQSGEDGFELRIQRCFAFDNVSRAGIAQQYECGILPRLMGWLDELGVDYELSPEPVKCLKAQDRECAYAFRFKAGGDTGAREPRPARRQPAGRLEPKAHAGPSLPAML